MKTMLRFLQILFFLVSGINLSAQTLAWVNATGSAGSDEIYPFAITTDASGNVIASGTFSGSFDFDPGTGTTTLTTLSGMTDVYVQKFDASGQLLWAVSLMGNGYSNVAGVKTDASGNIYLAGGFDAAVDFDPGLGTNLVAPYGDRDAFLLKLNASGAAQWVRHWGVSQHSTAAQALTVDMNNDVLVSGYFQDTVDFDPGVNVVNLAATGWSDNFIVKITAAGNFSYARSLSGTDYINVKQLSVDGSNNILVSGTFYGTVDFNPGAGTASLSSNNSEDVFLLKLAGAANFTWVRQLGNDGYESTSGIVADNAGNVYMAVTFSDSIDIDPGAATHMLYSSGNSGIMVLKLSPAGIFTWGKKLDGNSMEQVTAISIDNANHLYLSGNFSDTLDFDPGASVHQLVSNGGYDGFIASLDHQGNYRMAKQIGGLQDDQAVQVNIENTNQLYCLGLFIDTVDFDPSPTVSNLVAQSTMNQGDAFVFRWDVCAAVSTTQSAYHCDSVSVGGNTYTTSGMYTTVLGSSSGCDSLVNTQVTIGNNNVVLYHTQCAGGAYVLNGVSYTAPGTYVQHYTNQAGCDSNYTLHLGFGSPSSYLITDTACDVYFFGTQILFSSGVYTQVLTNASGCDSTVYLHLTINQSSYGSMSVSACDTYTFGGNTYNSSGFYTGIFVAANGCDSVIDLDLIIVVSNGSTQGATACESYTYNGQTYTSTGVYTVMFTNQWGCDSVVTLNLTINAPNVSVTQSGNTLTAAATPATYQWINCGTGNTPIPGATNASYTATANGSYAVIVTQGTCSDTSLCKTVSGLSANDLHPLQGIRVYPNPAHEQLCIMMDKAMQATVVIQNVLGQEVYVRAFSARNRIEIPVASWSAGTYWVRIISGGQQSVHSFTRQ